MSLNGICSKEFWKVFSAIPKSQLEKAGAWLTKCARMRHYGRNVMKVAKRVLERMCQDELVEKLSKLASAGTKREEKRIRQPMKRKSKQMERPIRGEGGGEYLKFVYLWPATSHPPSPPPSPPPQGGRKKRLTTSEKSIFGHPL